VAQPVPSRPSNRRRLNWRIPALALGDAIGEFAAEQTVALELLERMPNNLWAPSYCPLCAAGVAFEIAGTS
jgi:hypothetical protein